MAAPSTDPKQQNVNPQDDLTSQHNEVFMTPLVRQDGIVDEMPQGVAIDPQYLPTADFIKLKSPNGTIFIITVDDAGNLQVN